MYGGSQFFTLKLHTPVEDKGVLIILQEILIVINEDRDLHMHVCCKSVFGMQ